LASFLLSLGPDLNFLIGAFFVAKNIMGGPFSGEDLKQIEHPGYNTTYHYYHNECLQKVLDYPENYVKYVDTAIQIQDQINRNTLEAQEKIRRARLQIERLQIERARTMGSTPEEIPKKPKKQIEPKLLDRYALLKGKIE
jgi:hypothetical protein